MVVTPGTQERALPEQAITLELPDVRLPGDLAGPEAALGTVVFAHGSGSSRHSPRNRAVAAALHRDGLRTLLFDLLAEPESDDRAKVFDIDLLAGRLAAVVDLATEGRIGAEAGQADAPIGLFGASTGAAAALDAAALRPDAVRAVVSRGGRPDLSSRRAEVRAPVLLVVGGADEPVLSWNRDVAGELGAELSVVPGAGHLFEGRGELDRVATLAGDWFRSHLAGPA